MTDECPTCGDPLQYEGFRFSVTLEDYAESTGHHSQVNLCSDCWERVLDVIYGEQEPVRVVE